MRSGPPMTAALSVLLVSYGNTRWNVGLQRLPALLFGARGRGQLQLNTVDAVDAVNEQDKDEDKSDLAIRSAQGFAVRRFATHTFSPYCSFAMRGFSEMKVNSLRRQVNGRGMMSDMKITISATRSMKTCEQEH